MTCDTSLTKLEPTWCRASEQVEPIKRALHLARFIDTLTLFIHLGKSVTLGQSNSLQLNQTFKELAAGSYLFMAFLVCAQNVLP